MTEKEKMLAGKLYSAYKDGSLTEDRARRNRLLESFSSSANTVTIGNVAQIHSVSKIASKLFKHV